MEMARGQDRPEGKHPETYCDDAPDLQAAVFNATRRPMSAEHELSLIKVLGHHPGRNRAIGAGELYQAVYGKQWKDKIRDTRKLRALITRLRNDGYPICSTSDSDGGGYYLASAGSELIDHCRRLHSRAMKLLVMEARLMKITLPELMGQISTALAREKVGA